MAGRHGVLVMGRCRGVAHRFALRIRVPQRHLCGRHSRRRPVENERQDEHHAQKEWSERHVFTLPRPSNGMTRLARGALPLSLPESFVCGLPELFPAWEGTVGRLCN